MPMSEGYLPFHPNPKKPDFIPPAGAVDAHCHVFGPEHQFPYAPERKYTPCDAGKDKLFELRDYLGFSRNVIVQASCHGKNNDALVDALNHAGELARGVAVVHKDITKSELNKLNDAGVRAVRFNFVKRLVDSTPWEDFLSVYEKIKPLGWHVVVYFEAPDMAGLIPLLEQFETTLVVDHMGRPDVTRGVDSEEFQAFIEFMKTHSNVWTKVSCPERLTVAGPSYDDVIPFAKRLVETFPDRVLWGTDWPHPNMKSHTPDDGVLVDVIPKIAVTAELQNKLLIENPMKLYWSR